MNRSLATIGAVALLGLPPNAYAIRVFATTWRSPWNGLLEAFILEARTSGKAGTGDVVIAVRRAPEGTKMPRADR